MRKEIVLAKLSLVDAVARYAFIIADQNPLPSLQGLSERMAKVKRFLWALNFTKSSFSQLSLVEN